MRVCVCESDRQRESQWICEQVYLQLAYPGVTNEQGVLQLASTTEMGIRTQGCKPRLAKPADARTCHTQTHTHPHSKTHSL